MFLSNASIRRPVAMSCLIIGLGLLGLNAYRKMPAEFLPKVDIPYVSVITVYPGASPEELETDVASRIEDAVVSIDGLKHVSSICMENMVQTLLEFELEVSVDIAAMDVRESLDLIQSDFPAGVERPQVLKFDIDAIPIVNLAVAGDAPLDVLYDFADNELRDSISVLAGVADVQVTGGEEREVQVLLDRDALGARGLTSMNVVEAVRQGVQTAPSGRVREFGREYSVRFDADFDAPAALEGLEVANNEGARVYLGDVGRVVMQPAEMRTAAYVDGKPAVAVQVVKKAEANVVDVVESVRTAVAALGELVPGGVELIWVSDSGGFISETVRSATGNILQGVGLTGLILFLFLYNIRSTIIVAITMPITIIVTLFFMGLLGYTLNIPTLLALGLSVGILVTNSIVVLESIVKHLKTEPTPADAARRGTSEVAIAVFASAGTNLVVLLPIGLMGSIIGQFFIPFAFTMVCATVVSLFISFTLTPILSSLLLRKGEERGILHRLEVAWNAGLQWVSSRYADFLHIAAEHRWVAITVIVVVAAIFVHAMSLAGAIGFSFMDEPDQGVIFIKLEYPTSYNLDRTIARVAEAEAMLEGLPHVQHRLTTIGQITGQIGQASEGVYLAQVVLRFTDKMYREETIYDLLEEVRGRLEPHAGAIVTATTASGMGGQSVPIELEFMGADFDVLDGLALAAADLATGLDGFFDVDTTVREGKQEIRVRPRRAVLSDVGLPPASVGAILRANLEGFDAGVFKQGGRNYDIRVKLEEEEGKRHVGEFLLPGAPGSPVILASFAEIEENVAPIQITRVDKRRVAKLFSNLDPAMPLGTAVNELDRAIQESIELPPGYTYRFAGTYEMMGEATADFLEAGLIAIMLTFLVLSAILESFKRPFIILITIPLGLVGVLWALYLTGQSISVFVMLGFVMLVGIVVNNAILILDRAAYHVNRGSTFRESMVHAAADEFRPVIMITCAAVLGMLPMALGRGLGSEMRAGIGIASVGGVIVSAILTLIVLPVLYDLFTRSNSGEQRRSAAPKLGAGP